MIRCSYQTLPTETVLRDITALQLFIYGAPLRKFLWTPITTIFLHTVTCDKNSVQSECSVIKEPFQKMYCEKTIFQHLNLNYLLCGAKLKCTCIFGGFTQQGFDSLRGCRSFPCEQTPEAAPMSDKTSSSQLQNRLCCGHRCFISNAYGTSVITYFRKDTNRCAATLREE